MSRSLCVQDAARRLDEDSAWSAADRVVGGMACCAVVCMIVALGQRFHSSSRCSRYCPFLCSQNTAEVEPQLLPRTLRVVYRCYLT
jgi:hypothetical protein